MKNTFALGAAMAVVACTAHAGGVERAVLNPAFMFETGDYVELSFGNVNPAVSGTSLIPVGPFPAGRNSGDITPSYNQPSISMKTDLNDKLSLGFVVDTPIGADVAYPAGTGYIYGGSTAAIQSTALTVLMKYKATDAISVYGGIKAQRTKGAVALFNGYRMSTTSEQDYGYILGAAYEKPEIALRVSLTYTSAITHDFTSTESGAPGPTSFSSEVPQSLALDFQSGVAKDTLVFGSIRWREWSKFDISPPVFGIASGGSSLVDYDNNTVTYSIGVGRRLNENWSVAATLGHEKSNGGFAGNLGPTDGYTSIGLGATYTRDKVKITGGITYAKLGDAQTEAPAPVPAGTALGDFRNNKTVGVGFRIGYSF